MVIQTKYTFKCSLNVLDYFDVTVLKFHKIFLLVANSFKIL